MSQREVSTGAMWATMAAFALFWMAVGGAIVAWGFDLAVALAVWLASHLIQALVMLGVL